MGKKTIGVIVGSLRRGSYSRQIARCIAGLMPPELEMKFIDIGRLPMFNQDFDDDGATPEEWSDFRAEIKALDGFLFVTPEYNRSYPAVLKNALDVASRPQGQNCWGGKPGAIISVSPGKMSGFGANQHLRQVTSFLNIYMMQQPEAYIGGADKLLDDKGEVTDEGTLRFFQSIADAFGAWVDRF